MRKREGGEVELESYRKLQQDGRMQRAVRTAGARAQVWTLRERLLKLGAQVVVSLRRVVIHLPLAFPFLSSFRKIALAFGASVFAAG